MGGRVVFFGMVFSRFLSLGGFLGGGVVRRVVLGYGAWDPFYRFHFCGCYVVFCFCFFFFFVLFLCVLWVVFFGGVVLFGVPNLFHFYVSFSCVTLLCTTFLVHPCVVTLFILLAISQPLSIFPFW